ncbi:hypothetical protein BCU91_03770 [Shewanella sp. 10N.286.52.B9]|nr:hypothetical protein BCU91_03770 [Shewanella sp. 10N.286.52.B9]PMH85087.1 hypothetical protein BCU57_16045 [Shewanella sp. 10N.286.48.B5]
MVQILFWCAAKNTALIVCHISESLLLYDAINAKIDGYFLANHKVYKNNPIRKASRGVEWHAFLWWLNLMPL